MGEAGDLVERFYNAFNRGDMDAAADCYDENVRTIDPARGPSEGREAWRAFAESFKRALPDARLELRTALGSGDTIAVEGEFTGTFTNPLSTPQGEAAPTGNRIAVPYAEIFTARGGCFVEQHVYYDQVAMFRQLGLPVEAPAD